MLERLQERRQELDARARELDLRESMLKAAEKKLETQAAVEARPRRPRAAAAGGGCGQRPSARTSAENARFKSVVTMYETMKPKEAAKIFDRLDIRVLIEVASQIKPQRDVGDPGADVAGGGRAADRRDCAARGGADRTLNPVEPAQDRRPAGGG